MARVIKKVVAEEIDKISAVSPNAEVLADIKKYGARIRAGIGNSTSDLTLLSTIAHEIVSLRLEVKELVEVLKQNVTVESKEPTGKATTIDSILGK